MAHPYDELIGSAWAARGHGALLSGVDRCIALCDKHRFVTRRHYLLAVLFVAGCPEGGAEETIPNPTVVVESAPPTAADTGVPSATSELDAGPPPPALERSDLPEADLMPETLEEQRAAMLRRMRSMGVATDAQVAELRTHIESAKRMGQGNPAITEHPMTRAECMERRKSVKDEQKPMCGAPFMVPIYDPAKQKEQDAKVCMDRFEFPGLPCEYPMTWVTTKQARALCGAIGKRLCDAHEWEGACAGAVLDPSADYFFRPDRKGARWMHNKDREIIWAYGAEKDHTKCATGSRKSKKCGQGFRKCGSNTYPAGAFPECRSKFGVYDLHGNAAEHMNLPLKEEQLGSKGGFGVPEMKGSWFVFQQIDAHKDDCRWRAPSWHDNEGQNHSNYHLGFRCCKDVSP